MKQIINRSGRTIAFDQERIAAAIQKAFDATGELKNMDTNYRDAQVLLCAQLVCTRLDFDFPDPVHIEEVQDLVEAVLMERHPQAGKAYILYRDEHHRRRAQQGTLMQTMHTIVHEDARDSDMKRENANIDANTAMGSMLKLGCESSKEYSANFMLTPRHAEAHKSGDIHIHDLDFLPLTMTCCQIDLTKLFSKLFSTGYGSIRTPNDIATYGALAAIVIQANQNDMHGGQSIPSFDRDMAPGVAKTYRKSYAIHLADIIDLFPFGHKEALQIANIDLYDLIDDIVKACFVQFHGDGFLEDVRSKLFSAMVPEHDEYQIIKMAVQKAHERACRDTEKATRQAMQAFIHNLCTMHSRAGAQVPFSSVNYGTDTSPEGRMVTKCLLEATFEGLGNGETPIFPIQIFKVKDGINAQPGDPNYDLFRLACKVSAKRMFPNFSFLDAPFNLQYYREGVPESEVAYMGCRTRVLGNQYDSGRQITPGRGNLSFTSINLPRIAIQSQADEEIIRVKKFFLRLPKILELALEQLLDRLSIQSAKTVRNFPFLMGQGIWIDSEKLGPDDKIGEIIKHGTISIGFIGLAETLVSLTGKHHGECDNAQELGLMIVKYMRQFCDDKSKELGLNITLLATPAEGLAGRFVKLDRERFGTIPGVTDKAYYTNSFHIPVSYSISGYEKTQLEAPYHTLTNAGHITYVELDGDPSMNLDAFEAIVQCMRTSGIGYGAINHPIDRDPICGYSGIIETECPRCGRKETAAQPFERIRRITGYLVGSLEKFNDAKRAEVGDRVKHTSL